MNSHSGDGGESDQPATHNYQARHKAHLEADPLASIPLPIGMPEGLDLFGEISEDVVFDSDLEYLCSNCSATTTTTTTSSPPAASGAARWD
jgi:hypothetical protein